MRICWPRGKCSWMEYFMYSLFGLVIMVQRHKPRGRLYFAVQEYGLWGTSFVFEITMNHFHWIDLEVKFRHVQFSIGIWRPLRNTGFPTLYFKIPFLRWKS